MIYGGTINGEAGTQNVSSYRANGLYSGVLILGSEDGATSPELSFTSYNATYASVGLEATSEIISHNASIVSRSEATNKCEYSMGIAGSSIKIEDGTYKVSASEYASSNAALSSGAIINININDFKVTNYDKSRSDESNYYQENYSADLVISSNALILLEGVTRTDKYTEEG